MRNLRNFNKNARRDGKTAEQTLKEFGLSGDYEKYAGMDEDGLIAELMKSVREAKANGTYDPAQMQAFIALASPSPSPEQREKPENVVRPKNADVTE